jgi:hypothetical protein
VSFTCREERGGENLIKKELIVAVLLTFCLSAVLFQILPIGSQGAGDYDPWADINDDGNIDMYDIGYTARAFGTSGNPTKNVTITNWPAGESTTVWWYEPLSGGATYSGYYNASGLGHLHIQTQGVNMATDETITVRVHGRIWNPSGGSADIEAYAITLTFGASSVASVTIPVPNEQFRFSAYLSGPGSPSANIYLCYYLTWA